MTPALIELQNLHCERDQRVLFSGLNASIGAGDMLQIEGPNGSGKTTLLRLLTGTSSDFTGTIQWQGQALREARLDFLNQLLYIGHLAGVKKALSPRENLGWYAGLKQGHQRCTIEESLDQVGLYGYEDVACFQLSAGQQRRVALARLFLTPARVWVLDEPFTAIDRQGVNNLESLMAEHACGGGCIILTTHHELQLVGLQKIDLNDFKAASSSAEAQIRASVQ